MRACLSAGLLISLGLGLSGCGSSGYGNTAGTNPTSPTPVTTAGVVTINVVAINGAQSFSPNPASVPAGQMVVWHNVDTITHHVVFDDRSVDTGDLAPGASSQSMMIGDGPYHCTIHPVMVGSVNQDTAAAPPCQGAYCD